MSNFNDRAFLKNLSGTHFTSMVLNVASEFQFCVDAGASAAVCFFDDMNAVGLHDHVAISMHGFLKSLEHAIAVDAKSSGQWLSDRKQRCVDAFGAGYLGRIHQELRLFHDASSQTAIKAEYRCPNQLN